MATQQPPQKPPIKCHDKCPECGSERGLIKEYVEEERAAGNIGPDAFKGAGGTFKMSLVDPTLARYSLGQPVLAPGVQVHWEVCADCFTLYPTGVTFDPQLSAVKMVSGPGMPG